MAELPPQFSDIFTKDKNWCDRDLSKFKTHKYELLPEKTLARLVKLFQLCIWYPHNVPVRPFSRPINFAEITVAMASQLKSKELTPCLTSENEKIKPIKKWTYPVYISDPKIIPDLSNEQLDIIIEEFIALNTPSIHELFYIRLQRFPFQVKVAIFAYIATVCLRIGVKNITSIKGYMERHLPISLYKYYGIDVISDQFPLPTDEFFTKLSREFQLSTPISSNFYATCLDAYLTEYSLLIRNSNSYVNTAVISNALLTSTAGNGSQLIVDSCTYVKSRSFNAVEYCHEYMHFLKKVKDGSNQSAAESAGRFLEFVERYRPTPSHLKCDHRLVPGVKDILWPWARILDTTYFKSLRPDANQAFYAIQVAHFNEPPRSLVFTETLAYKRIPANLIDEAKLYVKAMDKNVRLPTKNPNIDNAHDSLISMPDGLLKFQMFLKQFYV